jgi:predicted Ser/Thr protein kinase
VPRRKGFLPALRNWLGTRGFSKPGFFPTLIPGGADLSLYDQCAQFDSCPRRCQASPWWQILRRGESESAVIMLKVKDTLRSTVHLTFDGRVVKVFHGPKADERFANEVRILHHLEARGCNFVPRVLEADAGKLRLITNNCGSRVEHLDERRTKELFAELEQFGVRHDDPEMRNVTYRPSDGRFCIIDFEFATLLPAADSPPPTTA